VDRRYCYIISVCKEDQFPGLSLGQAVTKFILTSPSPFPPKKISLKIPVLSFQELSLTWGQWSVQSTEHTIHEPCQTCQISNIAADKIQILHRYLLFLVSWWWIQLIYILILSFFSRLMPIWRLDSFKSYARLFFHSSRICILGWVYTCMSVN